jgi:hypothetical protein
MFIFIISQNLTPSTGTTTSTTTTTTTDATTGTTTSSPIRTGSPDVVGMNLTISNLFLNSSSLFYLTFSSL